MNVEVWQLIVYGLVGAVIGYIVAYNHGDRFERVGLVLTFAFFWLPVVVIVTITFAGWLFVEGLDRLVSFVRRIYNEKRNSK